MKHYLLLFCFLQITYGYGYAQTNSADKEKIKEEIRKMEKVFQDDLIANGVEYAFYKYAADNAVIKREGDTLITGKAAIKNYYSNAAYKNAVATWAPDFIDVSEDGTMAYTYGKYKWTMKDAAGKSSTFTGVFHTVWKKMTDGSWKYVWD